MKVRIALVSVIVGALVLAPAMAADARKKPPKYDLDSLNACFEIQLLGQVLDTQQSIAVDPFASGYSRAVDDLRTSKTKGAGALAKRMDAATNEIAQDRAVRAGTKFCNSIGVKAIPNTPTS